MTKTNEELLAIRDASYRVVRMEVCKTCQNWRRFRATDRGLCLLAAAGSPPAAMATNPDGVCDLWEGRGDERN